MPLLIDDDAVLSEKQNYDPSWDLSPPSKAAKKQLLSARLGLPPNKGEISIMDVTSVVKLLNEWQTNANVVKYCFERICALGNGGTRRQSFVDAGAAAAIVETLRVNTGASAVQEKGFVALVNVCAGADVQGLARKQVVADAGAVEVVLEGMKAHADLAVVAANGCACIGNVTSGADESGLLRKQQAADLGAIEAIVGALTAHRANADVVDYGAFALGNLCRARGDGATEESNEQGRARKQAAVDAGGLAALVAGMAAHEANLGLKDSCMRALSNITYDSDTLKEAALAAGARPEWLGVAATARTAGGSCLGVADYTRSAPAGEGNDEAGEEATA